VFAKVDIPAGSYIMPTHLAGSFEMSDDSLENISGEPMTNLRVLVRPPLLQISSSSLRTTAIQRCRLVAVRGLSRWVDRF